MRIESPDGDVVRVSGDKRLLVHAITENDTQALVRVGIVWTLPFTQAASDATDNVVWHFKNDSDQDFELMRLLVSSSIAGTWTIESGRVYSSGGTAITLKQLKLNSGITQDMTAYYGQDITLTGTAIDLYYFRTPVDTVVDILAYGPVIIQPSSTLAIKFNADSGTPTMTVVPVMHGSNPWD